MATARMFVELRAEVGRPDAAAVGTGLLVVSAAQQYRDGSDRGEEGIGAGCSDVERTGARGRLRYNVGQHRDGRLDANYNVMLPIHAMYVCLE